MNLLGEVTEDNVFTNLPENILRPNVVQSDGRGGVTDYSFARLLKSQLLETEARLRKEGVDQSPSGVTTWSPSTWSCAWPPGC